MCGNGICEIAERSVEGLLEGTCPEDCTFPSKVGGRLGTAAGCERICLVRENRGPVSR